MSTQLTIFSGQNWLITPANPLVGPLNERRNFLNQTWLLFLTGVVEANLEGAPTGDRSETVYFVPDGMLYPNPGTGAGPLFWTIQQYQIQPSAPHQDDNYNVCFKLEERQWAPFVTLSSIFDAQHSVNAGYAVERWRPTHFKKTFDLEANHQVDHIFYGVTADVRVRDKDANILKLSYNITLLGKIVFGGGLSD
jgi:hypothetical protein